jgi:hypothetical protein
MHTIKRAQTHTATSHPKNTNQTHWHNHTRAPRVCSRAVSLRLCRGQLFDILPRADFPPDPINHLCSLTGKYISENYFTYRSVQIFKILFPGLYPESDPPHKMMWYWFYYSTQLVFHFHLINMIMLKYFVPELYQFRRGISGGPALQYFYMIHRGGRFIVSLPWVQFHIHQQAQQTVFQDSYTYKHTHTHTPFRKEI